MSSLGVSMPVAAQVPSHTPEAAATVIREDRYSAVDGLIESLTVTLEDLYFLGGQVV